MKFKFWLLAALATVAMTTTFTSCEKDDPTQEKPTPDPLPTPSEDAIANEWMLNYMKTSYFWNKEVKNLSLENEQASMAYDEFLLTVLDGVAKQNNANREDGHWKGGAREYYYSNVTRSGGPATGAITRFGESNLFGFGFDVIQTVAIDGKYYFAVASVVDDSPAAKMGISRGTHISRVDGVAVSSTNFVELRAKLNPQTATPVQLTCHFKVQYTEDGVSMSDGKTITVTPASYLNNPVLYIAAFSSKALNTDIRCGYMAYKEFSNSFDAVLVEAFKTMTEASNKYDAESNPNPGPLTDMIIDLRFNPGGHLGSSVVMGTLIAGNAYKGQTYCAATYNEDRQKPKDLFKIGEAETPEGANRFIEAALQDAINLKCVYVLTNNSTASASELVINGLRGLGIEVRIVGDVTNGKNVGMEPVGRVIGDYTYQFTPITLRLENGKGFSDYSNGFTPDLQVDDPLIGNYCSSSDVTFSAAYTWIVNGEKPEATAAATRAANIMSVEEPTILIPRMEGAYLRTKMVE